MLSQGRFAQQEPDHGTSLGVEPRVDRHWASAPAPERTRSIQRPLRRGQHWLGIELLLGNADRRAGRLQEVIDAQQTMHKTLSVNVNIVKLAGRADYVKYVKGRARGSDQRSARRPGAGPRRRDRGGLRSRLTARPQPKRRRPRPLRPPPSSGRRRRGRRRTRGCSQPGHTRGRPAPAAPSRGRSGTRSPTRAAGCRRRAWAARA